MNVDAFFARLVQRAKEAGTAIAIDSVESGSRRLLPFSELVARIDETADRLAAAGRRIGILAGNVVDHVVVDLAAMRLRRTVVPLPAFFTDAQLRHVVGSAAVDAVVTDDPDRIASSFLTARREADVAGLSVFAIPGKSASLVAGSGEKISFTSGTTGEPKGVRLPWETQVRVAASVAGATRTDDSDRHLCALPLSILLENVGGVYRSLMSGATVLLRPPEILGVDGVSKSDPARLLATLRGTGATFVILMPRHLEDVVGELKRLGEQPPPALRFVAVGGAPVSVRVLERAEMLGLPVFEGYGLTEACSVVSVNTPTARRLGSVGRVLPHSQARIGVDGEIEVAGTTFAGYLGDERERAGAFWPTGDLGRIDDDGFLYIHGRKRDVIITSHGRNVSPAWLETMLTSGTLIESAKVIGDGLAGPVATLVCRHGRDVAAREVERVNQCLPEYARIQSYALVDSTPCASGGGASGGESSGGESRLGRAQREE